jgi:TetR/AcrR family fatty acid metabolism transcriptional regulator
MAKAIRKYILVNNKRVKNLNRKEDIIKVTAKLFSQKSFHDVKMDEIAEELGIAKGTIYLYFKSKEKLYLEILEESYKAIEALLENEIAIDEPSPVKLKKVLGIIFGFYRKNLDVLKILSRDETHLIKEHFEFTEHWRLRRLKLYEKILEKGIKQGSFNVQNPRLTALIIFGLVRSVMFFYSTKKDTTDIAEEVYHVITNGILRSKVSNLEKKLKVMNH